MSFHVNGQILVVIAVGVMMQSCRSPLEGTAEERLRASVAHVIEQELSSLPERVTRSSKPGTGAVEEALAGRREELDRLGPQVAGDWSVRDVGPDLSGNEQARVQLSLAQAITSAVQNNLQLKFIQIQPAISDADVINAEAVFDALLFSNVDLAKLDEPQTIPILNGIRLGTPFAASERYRFETGIRKRFETGADVSLSTGLERFRNTAPGIELSPDPAYASSVNLRLSQPLLRGIGSEVNTATIRLARNNESRSLEGLRTELLDVVEQTESAYWDLAQAWETLAVAEWLVEAGLQVRNVLERRMEFDVRQAEYSDAVATVEQRRATLIRARRQVRGASDALKVLINHPDLSISSETLLVPTDHGAEEGLTYDLRETLLSAVSRRPEVQQSLLAIDDADIRKVVANNARLPLLNANAELAYFGMDSNASNSYENLGDGDFIDYLVGLALEWPLGNRGAEAEYRRTRLERSAAVINHARTIQAVIAEVKRALRDVLTNHELIAATRSFRVAQAENLRTLLVEEETMAGLTPVFLNLKFTRQETLAFAQLEENGARLNLSKSLAALHRAMGVGLERQRIEIEMVDDEGIFSRAEIRHAAEDR